MRDRVKVAGYVSFYDPLVAIPAWCGKPFAQVGHSVIGASIGPESVGLFTKVRFPYRFEDHPQGFLYNPSAATGNA